MYLLKILSGKMMIFMFGNTKTVTFLIPRIISNKLPYNSH